MNKTRLTSLTGNFVDLRARTYVSSKLLSSLTSLTPLTPLTPKEVKEVKEVAGLMGLANQSEAAR
jgi:hypothetical protein